VGSTYAPENENAKYCMGMLWNRLDGIIKSALEAHVMWKNISLPVGLFENIPKEIHDDSVQVLRFNFCKR